MEQFTFTISPSSGALIPPPIQTSPQMNLPLNIPSALKFPTFSRSRTQTTTPLTCTNPRIISAASKRNIPARDRVIDFGKYKGRMLGTLPSTYLKWVTKNLRAADFQEWANLADEVLVDPVYRDRIEWEFADKLLTGNTTSPKLNGGGGAVSELLELSERFGWDNEDKSGWSKIDFGLLGSSKGGRIPRLTAAGSVNVDKLGGVKGRIGPEKCDGGGEEEEDDGGEKRRERRERMRQRRGGIVSTDSDAVGTTRISGGSGLGGNEATDSPSPVPMGPFPGRQALLNKARNRQRLF